MNGAITGRIRFDPSVPPLRDATVRVVLEDVTEADAPAREAGCVEIRSYAREPDDPPLEFTLEPSSTLDPSARYNLRAHVALSDRRGVQRGDLITVQSYPVATYGYQTDVTMDLRRID